MVANALNIKIIFFGRIIDSKKLLVFDSIDQDSKPIDLNLNNQDEKLILKKELSEVWSIFRTTHDKSFSFHSYDQTYSNKKIFCN